MGGGGGRQAEKNWKRLRGQEVEKNEDRQISSGYHRKSREEEDCQIRRKKDRKRRGMKTYR